MRRFLLILSFVSPGAGAITPDEIMKIWVNECTRLLSEAGPVDFVDGFVARDSALLWIRRRHPVADEDVGRVRIVTNLHQPIPHLGHVFKFEDSRITAQSSIRVTDRFAIELPDGLAEGRLARGVIERVGGMSDAHLWFPFRRPMQMVNAVADQVGVTHASNLDGDTLDLTIAATFATDVRYRVNLETFAHGTPPVPQVDETLGYDIDLFEFTVTRPSIGQIREATRVYLALSDPAAPWPRLDLRRAADGFRARVASKSIDLIIARVGPDRFRIERL